jgi:hypothetical protein
MFPRRTLILLAISFTMLCRAHPASAIPAFARKYKTSCTTCHTIFPKLNPFGEQFRRNSYRFPGVDGDNTKAEPVALGTDEQKKMFPESVWPATLSPFPPLALGFNGQAVIHPDRSSSGGAADNGAVFNIDNQVEEAHLWAAGSIDDSITFFSELTFSPDGVEVENASLYFGDLVGPDHAVNIAVGKRGASLTSFAPHSSYITDMTLPMVPVTGLYGATSDPFMFGDNHNGIEINGVLDSRLGYAAGVAAGTNLDTRNSANVYGHVGYKIGGSTLDGENTDQVPQDLEHEQAITIDAFAYRSVSRFSDAAMALTKDTSLTLGGTARLQYQVFELDVGAFWQTDDHVVLDSPVVTTIAEWNEASWLPYPWLVVAARVELLHVALDGAAAVSDLRITPGVAVLVRPNIRFALTAPIERASGAPDAGWEAAGLAAAPAMPDATIGPEIEAIELGLFTAF